MSRIHAVILLLFSLHLMACNNEETGTSAATQSNDAGVDIQQDLAVQDFASPTGLPPEIDFITPPESPYEGETQVSIYGDHLVVPIDIYFGDNEAESVNQLNEELLSVIVPPATVEGAVDVRAETRFGSFVLEGGFTYLPSTRAQITQIDPPYGITTGGQEIFFTGLNLPTGGVVDVIFGSEPSPEVLLDSETGFSAISPEHDPDELDLTFNFLGDVLVVTDAFTYYEPLILTMAIPNAGPAEGGNDVLIYGEGLEEEAEIEIFFGDSPVAGESMLFEGDYVLVAAPPGVAGVVDILASGKNGEFILENAYAYDEIPFALDSLEPDTLPLEGGEVAASGTGFDSEAEIDITVGELSALDVTPVSDTELLFTAPAQELPGSYPVIIQQAELQVTLEEGLTYEADEEE